MAILKAVFVEGAVRRASGFLLGTAMMSLLPYHAEAAATRSFDGSWLTTVSCPAARDALGYSYRFTSTVKTGALHGVRGTAGEPSSLELTGVIAPDGSAKLYAKGILGSKEYVPGRETPRGTEYDYNIDAHFTGTTGSGSRVEGRACTLQFSKQ